MKSKINDSPIRILVKDQYIFYCSEVPSVVDKGKILKTRTSMDDNTVQSYFLFEDIAYQGIYVDDD